MSIFPVFARTGIVACALFLGATTANATTTSFDFTGGSNTPYANGDLAIPSFDGGVSFYAFDYDKVQKNWGSAPTSVIHTEDGIGVWAREEYANDQNHVLAPYVDSYTSLEYLVMKLPTLLDWTPLTATFTFLNQQNFSIFGYNDTTAGDFLSTGAAFSGILSDVDDLGSEPASSNGVFEFADGIGAYEYIIFTTTTTSDNNNRFLLSGFEGLAQVVPVPAALPLLLSGLGGIGLLGFMRRRAEEA